MQDTEYPAKTAAGMRELSQRQHKLHARSRLLLIAIHGGQPIAELRRQFHVIGDVDQILAELSALGLIMIPRVGDAVAASLAATQAANASVAEAPIPPLQLARQLMNESAVAALGLRAFLFTLKLERCYSITELNGLLPEYHRVLAKAKGAPFANILQKRVQGMLEQAAA